MRSCLVCALALLSIGIGNDHDMAAAELQTAASQAYATYAAAVEKAFLGRVQSGSTRAAGPDGVIEAGPGGDDGVIRVTGGLVHHWIGSVFVPEATVREAIELSRAYDKYPDIYHAVVAARLLGHEGDTYHASLRVKGGEAGISAVLQIRSTVRYATATAHSAYSITTADEIREVEDADSPKERLLPPGRDSGYLWRANTFSWLVERERGLYMEMETLGLSRPFPPLLGWLIEPIARHLGRKSVEVSLREFMTALRKTSAAPPAATATTTTP